MNCRKSPKKIAFGWYGGKFSHLGWLLPLLPQCQHYCEPFAGSAAVLLNRKPSPVETYNDLDGNVVNFFKVLREKPEELIRLISLTPFARDEFVESLFDCDETLERARRFFVRARQVRSGLAQTATPGRWASCGNTSRNGMSGTISRWFGGISHLSEIAERLLRVQIENRPAIEVIHRFDSPETLFYVDPPYPHESRNDSKAYGYEMTDEQHRELATVLHSVKGSVAISGYQCPLMNDLYTGWRKEIAPAKPCRTGKQGLRQEILWCNY